VAAPSNGFVGRGSPNALGRYRAAWHQPEGSSAVTDAFAEDATPILPPHIEETVKAIGRVQAQHESEATPLERLMEQLTAAIGRPAFLVWLALAVAVWVLGNGYGARLGYTPIDPPPFSWLQGAISLSALSVTVIILTSQRRADKLAGLRAQLTLELAILGEQKTAKVIELIEQTRRDNPLLENRVDLEANAMAKPADPEAVLDAIAAAPEAVTDDAAT
jgi:uncharacterized membrane protein